MQLIGRIDGTHLIYSRGYFHFEIIACYHRSDPAPAAAQAFAYATQAAVEEQVEHNSTMPTVYWQTLAN